MSWEAVRAEARGQELEVGGWRLEARGGGLWRLEAGGWLGLRLG
jgi:hypothetical protein